MKKVACPLFRAYQLELVHAMENQLGYKLIDDIKVISTDEKGQGGKEVKGFITTENDTIYSNDKNQNSTLETIATLGQEIAGTMQKREGIDITTNRKQHNDYQDAIAKDIVNDVAFTLNNTNYKPMAQTNNHVQPKSLEEYSQLQQNNAEFAGLDKEAGDNLSARDGAKISMYVYKDNPNAKLPSYIKEITDEATLNKYRLSQKDLVNDKTGFKSSVYINKITGEVTYAYAGTDGLDAKDIKTNILQGIGLTSDAYRQAISNAIKFNDATNELGIKASLTGHSLGGGEAAAGSEKTGLEAKTYNASGVHPFTVISGKGTSAIDNYFMKNDPLSIMQNIQILLPDASGRQHMLNSQKGKSTLENLKDGHSIMTIIKSLNLKAKK